MSLLDGINHAAVLTADLSRFVEFYSNVFGAQLVFEETTAELRPIDAG